MVCLSSSARRIIHEPDPGMLGSWPHVQLRGLQFYMAQGLGTMIHASPHAVKELNSSYLSRGT